VLLDIDKLIGSEMRSMGDNADATEPVLAASAA